MSAYSELIKNFEKIRAYMRDFYIYGFKIRDEYDRKSARSYDDERRRMESWLDGHMSFARSSDGKNVFISIDSRVTEHNPLYRAFKSKSFTDGDITLHFILFDILNSPKVKLSLPEIMTRIDENYLSGFDAPMTFDESTVRKKLKEYEIEGLIISEKQGKKLIYRRAHDVLLPNMSDALSFFSEVAPCGVIGSFLLDKQPEKASSFAFKHHYINGALDSEILATLFDAMREKRAVKIKNHSKNAEKETSLDIVPLRVFISVQSGRQHLLAYQPYGKQFKCLRLDYITSAELSDPCEQFDELRAELDSMQENMWGVGYDEKGKRALEHVDFTVYVGKDEEYIISRLEREKRVGTVEKVDDRHYRFTADVYRAEELMPWIRTFICRIVDINFSDKALEIKFKRDLENMYKAYGIE